MVDFITNTINIYVLTLGCIGMYVIYKWLRDNRLSEQARYFLLSIALLGFDMPIRAGYYAVAGLTAEDGCQYNSYMTVHGIWIAAVVTIVGAWGAFRIIRQVEERGIKYGVKMCGISILIALTISVIAHWIFQW